MAVFRIDPAGWPFVAGALLPATASFAMGWPVPGAMCAVLAAFFLFFFRDPDRQVPSGPGVVVAPADGRVVHAGPPEPNVAPPGAWQQISIFLSPLDVHINRTPIGGRVVRVTYQPGKFLPAYRPSAATENERNEIWIEHDGQTVVCRQVVGILARRIVCRLSPGNVVETGQRFGIMRFGSRTDLFLPSTAVPLARVTEMVKGGETVVARLSADP
jgi:phosphatidylserine decarboxylase